MKSKKAKFIAGIIGGVIIAVALTLFITLYLVPYNVVKVEYNSAREQFDAKDETVPVESESAEWRIETAQITGIAAETEYKDFNRKNVHITNVEEYIREVIRPIYQEIVNSTNPTEINVDGVTWYLCDHSPSQRRPIPDNISSFSSILCVKYASGTDGNEYERRYYFDRLSDELVFALWTKNGMERRLYFYKSSIIRYIDENGARVDNPTEPHILSMAETSLREGFVHWD